MLLAAALPLAGCGPRMRTVYTWERTADARTEEGTAEAACKLQATNFRERIASKSLAGVVNEKTRDYYVTCMRSKGFAETSRRVVPVE